MGVFFHKDILNIFNRRGNTRHTHSHSPSDDFTGLRQITGGDFTPAQGTALDPEFRQRQEVSASVTIIAGCAVITKENPDMVLWSENILGPGHTQP